jgi:uncharacterized OsmC-like protein
MQLVTPSFKSTVEEMRSKIATAKDPNQTIGTVRADASLLGQQYSEVKARDFVIASDEPVPSGGTNKGPIPLDFFTASIGFCENVTFAKQAALKGLDFTSLETSVRGHFDRKGMYEIDGASPNFIDMIVETKVTSSAPIEKIAEVARITHRTCPMHATIVKAMKVTDKLFVNGKEITL